MFMTFGSRGGVVFVINGAWQLGDKLLTTDQGACWFDGRHTLRLLQPQGKLLFSEINWLAGSFAGSSSVIYGPESSGLQRIL